MLLHDPDYALQFEIPARKLPIRMWYMYKNKVCTLIDVDEVKQIVQIKNYADNIMFRAFGSNQKHVLKIIGSFWSPDASREPVIR